jgi:hypothetical protein
MEMHNERVARLVAEANSYLRWDTARDILLPADDVPEWFTDLCHHAHGSMMPDDWRYEFIQDALSALEDGADEDRLDLDGLYPYTADRFDWLSSHLDRPAYCDAAAAAAGEPPGDILAFVAWGMGRELREVFGLVRSGLEEIAEGEDDEGTD